MYFIFCLQRLSESEIKLFYADRTATQKVKNKSFVQIVRQPKNSFIAPPSFQ